MKYNIQQSKGNYSKPVCKNEDFQELKEAIENIKATLRIQKKRGNPDADFLLKRL
ncbi:MAG: hypothetical protein JW864_06135 [Spirochaetes bacterium]|nr:hypothetical protein [Spirochaetota bacterium]